MLSTGDRINSYCDDPTDRSSQSLCGLVDRTLRCDECGATNNGLDAKTGLVYINNGDACQKDAVYFIYSLYCLVRVSLANERCYDCRIVAVVDCALHANLKRSNRIHQIGSISATRMDP